MYYHDVSAEVKLYYIFMQADGGITEEEEKKFNEICTSIGLSKNDKKQLMTYCDSKFTSIENNLDRIKLAINEVLNIESGKKTSFFSTIARFMPDQKARVIWTMINLGYSDSSFSQIEKDIISYLVDNFELENALYKDMLDSAETILFLINHNEWLKKQNFGYDTIHLEIIQNEKRIKKIYQDVKENIEEMLYLQN